MHNNNLVANTAMLAATAAMLANSNNSSSSTPAAPEDVYDFKGLTENEILGRKTKIDDKMDELAHARNLHVKYYNRGNNWQGLGIISSLLGGIGILAEKAIRTFDYDKWREFDESYWQSFLSTFDWSIYSQAEIAVIFLAIVGFIGSKINSKKSLPYEGAYDKFHDLKRISKAYRKELLSRGNMSVL